jgi:type VI secretion system secreted protein Hcp
VEKPEALGHHTNTALVAPCSAKIVRIWRQVAGKAAFGDFSFTSKVSGASPQLFLACASGKHVIDAALTVRKAGGKDPSEFYKVTFNDVLISSYQDSADTGAADAPREQVSFNYAKITVTYTGQNAKGTANPPQSASWDLKKNQGG